MADRVRLTLVATPIGHLGDLSPRAIETLRSADVIACEDTRHSRKLLSHAGITGSRLIAVHEHNERDAAAGIVALLERGQEVALVSDAGTPGVSDPGERVVAAVLKAGFDVQSVPGPVAAISALIISGLSTRRFVFEGFLPERGRERHARLAEVGAEPRTVILYEAPHRVVTTLADLAQACGPDRLVSVSRELTKLHEATWRGCLRDAAAAVAPPRGEYVIVVNGAEPTNVAVDAASVDALLTEELERTRSVKDAAAAVAQRTGVPRNELYDRALELRASPVAPDPGSE